MLKIFNKRTFLMLTVAGLRLAAVGILLYLVIMPFYPRLKYEYIDRDEEQEVSFQSEETVREETARIINHLPENEFAVSPNRIIIPKIGVNAPIIESASSEYGLSRGAWHMPESSTPDKGGNTVITGHRFKYLPPNNLTFYLFHELEAGDIASVIWQGEEFYYRIFETKIIEPTDFSILNRTDKSILTMFTCHPIYSTDKRLVVIGELIESQDL